MLLLFTVSAQETLSLSVAPQEPEVASSAASRTPSTLTGSIISSASYELSSSPSAGSVISVSVGFAGGFSVGSAIDSVSGSAVDSVSDSATAHTSPCPASSVQPSVTVHRSAGVLSVSSAKATVGSILSSIAADSKIASSLLFFACFIIFTSFHGFLQIDSACTQLNIASLVLVP